MNREMVRGTSVAQNGFTLIELLVVIAVIASLLSIFLPAIGSAREQAQVVAVNAELYQIGVALEAYALDHDGVLPPTGQPYLEAANCPQMPEELVDGVYLPEKLDPLGPLESGLEDRFDRGHTYKYVAPADLTGKTTDRAPSSQSMLWVPEGFPDAERAKGRFYYEQKESPVSWAIFSLGPDFDYNDPAVKALYYPVPRSTWYHPSRRKGVLARIRLANGRHVGTF